MNGHDLTWLSAAELLSRALRGDDGAAQALIKLNQAKARRRETAAARAAEPVRAEGEER